MEVEGGVEWTHELLVDGVCEHGHAPGHVHHGEVADESHGGHGAGAAAPDLVLQQVGGVELETGGHAHVMPMKPHPENETLALVSISMTAEYLVFT